MTSTLCAATFSNSYVKWRLRYVMLRFVAVPTYHYVLYVMYFALLYLFLVDEIYFKYILSYFIAIL